MSERINEIPQRHPIPYTQMLHPGLLTGLEDHHPKAGTEYIVCFLLRSGWLPSA